MLDLDDPSFPDPLPSFALWAPASWQESCSTFARDDSLFGPCSLGFSLRHIDDVIVVTVTFNFLCSYRSSTLSVAFSGIF
jgi:hypothetical protein